MTDETIKNPVNMKSTSVLPIINKNENNSLSLMVGSPVFRDRISDFNK
jgi:hypothetical protein